MTLISKLLAAAGLCFALLSPAVQADSLKLSITGGSNSSLENIGFNPTWTSGLKLAGYELETMHKGGELNLSKQANLVFTFVGKEAAFNNIFEAYKTAFATDGHSFADNAFGHSFQLNNVSAGKLNFGFFSNGSGSLFSNGDSSIGLVLADNRKSALILFNDKGGDRDFDDMVIKISILAVPEPESYAMLLAGLGLMGTIARRRKSRD